MPAVAAGTMEPLRRRLLNVLTLLSLLLCVAACVLWVRSYSRLDKWERVVGTSSGNWEHEVRSACGLILFRRRQFLYDHPEEASRRVGAYCEQRWGSAYLKLGSSRMLDEELDYLLDWRGLGLGWGHHQLMTGASELTGRATLSMAVVPHACVVIATAVAPLLSVRAAIRRRRRARGNRCVACGYDLTGNVSGVCPECGHGRAADQGL